MTTILPVPREVRMALDRLKSLGEGDLGVLDVVACGGQTVAPLRAFLFEREPSGKTLRTELAFYVGCLNAQAALAAKEQPTCFPSPTQMGECRLSFRGLYDVSLALNSSGRAVGNDLDADGKRLLVVTGANQGGKTTYLHGVGQAQLMMQAGMFAPANSFGADLRDRIFTHFKREEDASMNSGKLDEELLRISDMVEQMTHHSLALFNESFAATNDREGSEINRQIVSALIESGIKVVAVTHLYEFARKFYDTHLKDAISLRADRREDGTRTFKVREGEPLLTLYSPEALATEQEFLLAMKAQRTA